MDQLPDDAPPAYLAYIQKVEAWTPKAALERLLLTDGGRNLHRLYGADAAG